MRGGRKTQDACIIGDGAGGPVVDAQDEEMTSDGACACTLNGDREGRAEKQQVALQPAQ